jgi:hypothetical protein
MMVKMLSKTKEYVKEYNKSYRNSHKREIAEYKKKYNKLNKERIIEYQRKYCKNWRLKNKDKKIITDQGYYKNNAISIKERAKKWYANNKVKRNSYILNKLKTDINFRIACRIRNRVRRSLLIFVRTGKVYAKKYGINYKSIIEHLKPFPQDISKYHIDHIKPLCSFNLSNPEQIKIAFAPENHQWLLAEDNLKKGNR